jgi:hypothetical protein
VERRVLERLEHLPDGPAHAPSSRAGAASPAVRALPF